MNSLGTEGIEVKYLGKNNKGKHQLSRKEALLYKQGTGGGSSQKKPPQSSDKPAPQPVMSKEEMDVIDAAIEGINDL